MHNRPLRSHTCASKSWQPCLCLEEVDHLVADHMVAANKMTPILVRVLAPGDGQVLVIGPERKTATLKATDHRHELVVDCRMIAIAVKHVNRLPTMTNRSRN